MAIVLADYPALNGASVFVVKDRKVYSCFLMVAGFFLLDLLYCQSTAGKILPPAEYGSQ
ncbi:hypothetical protein ACFL0R_07045 [Pseudomonadota bacterium]